MRIAIVLIIGLLAGALGGIKAYQSFAAGSEVPHAVMWMMRYHFGAVGDAIKAGQCGPEAVGSHIDTLARMADDIDINTGTILDGIETVEASGEKIFERIIAVASGERTVVGP